MKRMLITGASGMLGSAAIKFFADKYECFGTDIVYSENVSYLADITNHNEILKIFEIVKPDIVLHCAAMINVDECEENSVKTYKINTLATLNIADICNSFNAKMIYISTSMVFDGKSKISYNETDSPLPINVYSFTKYEGERMVISRAKDYLIIRTNIFGTKDKSFGMWMYRFLKDGLDLSLYRNIKFNTIYIPDFLKYLNIALEAKGIYHITSRDYMSKLEFGKLMKEKTFYQKSKIKSKLYNHIVKRPKNAVLDCSKFEKEFDVKLPTISETMDKFIKDVMIYG